MAALWLALTSFVSLCSPLAMLGVDGVWGNEPVASETQYKADLLSWAIRVVDVRSAPDSRHQWGTPVPLHGRRHRPLPVTRSVTSIQTASTPRAPRAESIPYQATAPPFRCVS